MNPARISLVLALGFAVFGCASAPPAPEEPLIDSLDIQGARSVAPSLIRARIVTAGTSWLPFSEKHYYDEGVLETDLKRILRLYQANGFYKARIVSRDVTPVGKNEVDITIRIDEGPPTRVTDLVVEGLDALPDAERARLLKGLPLAIGGIFSEEGYDTLRAQLAERLRENGFAEAEVDGVVQVHLEENTAEIVINASTGQRFRYGEIFVAGANQVPRKRIYEAVRDVLPPGKVYSDSALAEAESRLFDLGVFSAAKVSRGAPDRRAGTVPIVVSVREAPFRTIRVGGGVGIDPARIELPRVTGDLTNRNFFGGLRRLTFTNTAALVLLNFPGGFKNAAQRGIAFSSALEFQQPDLFRRDLSLTSSVGYDHGVEPSYKYDAVTGALGVIWRVSRFVSVVPSYNLSLFGLNPEGNLFDAIRSGSQEAVLDSCAKDRKLCRLGYLEQRITWDRRDNPIASTRGGLLSISFQQGSKYLGGAYDYLRVLPELRLFFPFGPHVLATRVMAGALVPKRGTESSVLTRFYLGGSTTQRGFGSRQLSPSVAVATSKQLDEKTKLFPAEVLPVGGNGMLGANIEARIALPANFGFVLFVDTGTVTPSVADLATAGLHVATGVGLRYRTVFGPVRLDFAYRLLRPPISIEKLGEEGVPPDLLNVPQPDNFSISFSIGEAF